MAIVEPTRHRQPRARHCAIAVARAATNAHVMPHAAPDMPPHARRATQPNTTRAQPSAASRSRAQAPPLSGIRVGLKQSACRLRTCTLNDVAALIARAVPRHASPSHCRRPRWPSHPKPSTLLVCAARSARAPPSPPRAASFAPCNCRLHACTLMRPSHRA